MDLDDFAAVRAIVRTGTFSAAARELRVTQPALSRRVARIERQLNGRLFDRMPRHAAPTSLGQAIADAAGRIDAERQRAQEEASAIAAGLAGRIQMASLAGGIPVLAKGLVTFQEHHPAVWVELRALGVQEAVRALREREVDLATLPGSVLEPGMRSRKLASWRAVIAVRPDHVFAKRRSVAISQLAAEPVLMLAPEFMVAHYVSEMARRTGVRLNARLHDGTPEAVISLARRGWGVGVLPDSVRLPAGLVSVPLAAQGSPAEYDYVVAWIDDRTLPPAALELVKTLERETEVFR